MQPTPRLQMLHKVKKSQTTTATIQTLHLVMVGKSTLFFFSFFLSFLLSLVLDFIIPPTELMKTILGMGGKPPSISVPPGPHVLPSLDLEGIAAVIKSGVCKKIVLCTGAGISVAAGIPDFRTPGTGLYDNLQKYDLPKPTAVFGAQER